MFLGTPKLIISTFLDKMGLKINYTWFGIFSSQGHFFLKQVKKNFSYLQRKRLSCFNLQYSVPFYPGRKKENRLEIITVQLKRNQKLKYS